MRRRGLSPEERALWAQVRRSVRRIGRLPAAEEAAEEAAERRDDAAPAQAPASPAKRAPPAARPASRSAETEPPVPPVPPVPPLAPLEPKARRRLARGAAEPQARLDLHGMRQASAYQALAGFLHQAQARGARTVLVITGKGRSEDEPSGVLRQVLPRWLAEPRFRPLVVGFEPAARRHGGEGAFYVRLRRRRRPGEP